ncbi:MAG TPA: HAMP domain-containing histidine kinase [Aeromonadales bacterium]|nr:HAMP domain-containing histidine kinase [Aeromonadales bacterium]
MLNLFWRIFLSFWVSLLIFILAGTWLGKSLNADNKVLPLNPLQTDFVRRFRPGNTSISLHHLQKMVYNKQNHKPVKKIWLLDKSGQQNAHSKLPQAVTRLWEMISLHGKTEPSVYRSDHSLWFGPLKIDTAVGPRWLIIETDIVRALDSRNFYSHPLFRLLILIVASIAAALLVSRFLTRPIKQLQSTVKQLTHDLSARPNNRLLKRNDELGKLANQINEMAETIEKLLNSQQQILWDVSHELRSPLARIQTTLAIAEQQNNPQKALQRLNNEVIILNQMISQLLLLGRLNAEIQKINREPVPLKNLLQHIHEDMKLENSQPLNITLSMDEKIDVYGDPVLLSSLFGNLMRNAREHNPPGTAIVVLANEDKDHTEIIFRDQGQGVNPSRLEQLFQPFHRGSINSTGLGLGLTIVQNIVKQHHGTIELKNCYETSPSGEKNEICRGFEVIICLPKPAE